MLEWNTDPTVGDDEARSIANEAAFERFYEEWESKQLERAAVQIANLPEVAEPRTGVLGMRWGAF